MGKTIVIKQLPPSAITRIGEIDRTQHVTLAYRVKDGTLQAEPCDWKIPPWATDHTGPHSVAEKIRAWSPLLQDGVLLGALDGDRLAGFAILRYKLTDTMAQLAVLHISQLYRRQRIGQKLVAEVVRLAKLDGATALYVSAMPSAPTVHFYQAQGFELTAQPHPELFALEPEDIHMVRQLA